MGESLAYTKLSHLTSGVHKVNIFLGGAIYGREPTFSSKGYRGRIKKA